MTINDVRQAFRQVVVAGNAAGMDTTNWVLIEGGEGQTWKLVDRDPKTYGHSNAGLGLSDNFLGSNRRDAYNALRFLSKGMWAVVEKEN